MDPNTGSTRPQAGPAGLGRLAAAVNELAGQDLAGLPDAEAAARVLVLRGLLERLEGQWLRELAAVDARGAAGAEDGVRAASTAGWLRGRLRVGAAATRWVGLARALFRGPLAGTGRALAAGELSAAHAAALAQGVQDLPARTAAAAEPVLLEAALRPDPPRLRRLVAHLVDVADPDGTAARAQRQHERRGIWLSPTFEGMLAVDGCWTGRPARRCWPPWSRWPARPAPRTGAAAPSGVRTRWPSWPGARSKVAGCHGRAGLARS